MYLISIKLLRKNYAEMNFESNQIYDARGHSNKTGV